MGFSSNGVNNWKLIDLNITTNPASGTTSSGNGKSNYAVYITGAGSTGYEIIRTAISSGTASAGTAGVAGSNGSPGGAR
jgi:hypothetical protein